MNICMLGRAEEVSARLLGGKAANLARLLKWGMPVPDGFVVTTDAYAEHALRAGIPSRLSALLDVQDVRAASSLAAKLLSETRLDSRLETELVEAWTALGAVSVAVRSSATSEDLETASFAGQHDSYLEIRERAGLLKALASCWASLWSERAIRYRRERGISPASVQMAVVVQRMVPAEAAGVLFTVDPITQLENRMTLEIVPGLGDALVSGTATGESCALERTKSGLRLEGRRPGLLTRSELMELGQLALKIEALSGGPQDIEFAKAKGRIAILQARPITTLGERIPPPPPLRYMDRRMRKLALERYAIAPRPLDGIAFVRMVGAAAYAAERFGFRIDRKAQEEFRARLWHQQYQFPSGTPTPRMLLHPLLSLRMMRVDWLKWWMGEPRSRLEATGPTGNLASLADDALFQRADALLDLWSELCNERFYAVSSIYAESSLQCFVALAVGPKEAGSVTALLLSGIPSPALEANEALWELSRVARKDPAALRAIRDACWTEVPTEGEFAQSLAAFLSRYGHCESGGFYLSLPTWRQKPTLVLQILRSLLSVENRAQGTELSWQQARKRIEGRFRWFPWLRRTFSACLEQVRALHRMREESHHDLTRPLDALQEVVGEFAQRLKFRGMIKEEDDVFFLTYEEIRGWLASGPTGAIDPAEFIARRRRSYRVVNARWQRGRESETGDGDTMRGVGASSGQIRARARIIRDESAFDRLLAGEVLVCPYSNPSWTPLFISASAVVSDTGGVASHAAIVAREYGIPAVMGVAGATSRIRDGQILLVDGDSGKVVLLPEDSARTG